MPASADSLHSAQSRAEQMSEYIAAGALAIIYESVRVQGNRWYRLYYMKYRQCPLG